MGEEPTKTVEPDEGTPTPTPEQTPQKAYTQADVDNITEKVRAGLTSKLTAQEKQLEELKARAMTEQEKAIEDAKKAGADEVRAELEVFKRQATIERLLAAKGIVATDKVARLIDPAEDPAEGVAQLEKDMPQLFTSTKVGGGGGRSLTMEGGAAITEEYASEQIQIHGSAWLTPERRAKLQAWRDSRPKGHRRL